MSRPESVGSIEVIRRLAVGGMSEVFLAKKTLADGSTHRVVVKRLLPGAGAEGLSILRREREALSVLDSPFIVRLLGGTDDEIVLEYVDGPDLGTLLAHLTRRGRTLSLGAAMAVMEGVLMGLRDLHGACSPRGEGLGLVHRDLSPGNVLVSRDGAVKLADLGVVHREDAGMRTTPGIKGTLAYMAPEQLRGAAVDARTDLYAAGLIAYEVFTGVPARPAGLGGLAELIEARTRLPTPPSEVRPGLPRMLDAPVLKALEPDPVARFSSAFEMWEALLAAAGTAPDRVRLAEAAREVSGTPYRLERTVGPDREVPRGPGEARRRRRRWVWLAVGLPVLGVGLLWVRSGPFVSTERAQSLGLPPASAKDPGVDSPEPDESLDAGAVSSGEAPSGPRDALHEVLTDRPARPPSRAEPRSGPRPARALVVAPAGVGAVHVSGDGVRGLAPVRVPMAREGPLVLMLHAGPSALAVRVRVQAGSEGPVAFIGAPEGRYYQVSCGGADLGPTPVGPVRIGAGLACRAEAPDGSAGAFELRVEGGTRGEAGEK